MITPRSDSRLRAVLGPTNTGKTHLAIERLCGHSSGAIGFPLRLLAREVYDRVRAIKGDNQVALITGEERIEPEGARYYLCTAEAMPRDGGGLAFVALDEVQLAADRERGHIFTDRLLNARGREETMLLGSATIEPIVKALLPKTVIEDRPRFSTLSYAGAKKLSRLPPRSAVVAFSVEQVYAVAEMLRRFRGGAAVVMGGLSPETRNRQVQLFQSGEVDYIVATDAIGMGVNLDVTHVAFASLSKFDGVRQRRLTPAEMAHRFRASAELARAHGVDIAVHVAEPAGEAMLLDDFTGPFAEQWQKAGIPRPSETPVTPMAWLDRHGVLSARTTCIHAIDVPPDDMVLMKQRGVAVAHCPRSNRFHHGADAPVARYLEAGLRVGLGTDSEISVAPPDLFAEALQGRIGDRLPHVALVELGVAGEHHVAAGDVGAHLAEAGLLAHGAQLLHRQLAGAADVDRAQQGDPDHARCFLIGHAPDVSDPRAGDSRLVANY